MVIQHRTAWLLLFSAALHGAAAQDSTYYSGPDLPRFAVGGDVFYPTYQVFDGHVASAVSIQATYSQRNGRSWRLGYGYYNYEDDGWPSWIIRDSFATMYYDWRWVQAHQVNAGYQWDLGNGRIRPFAGLDLIVIRSEVNEIREEQTIHLDSSYVSLGSATPASYQYTGSYNELLRIGPSLAAGLDIRVHRHLSIQARLAAASLFDIVLHSSGDDRPDGYGPRRFGPLLLGSGVYLMFRF